MLGNARMNAERFGGADFAPLAGAKQGSVRRKRELGL